MAMCDVERSWAWPAMMRRPATLPLAIDLDHLRDEFAQIAAEAAEFAATLSDAQFAWKPAEDQWSIGECLSHLVATARLCMPKIDAGIGAGIRHGLHGDGPFRFGWTDTLIVQAFGPASHWRVRSPRAFLPVRGTSRDDVLSAFDEVQRQFIERLRQADGLDLARVRVASPVAPWWRFSLGAAFAVLASHERRHLSQARRVATLPQFPR